MYADKDGEPVELRMAVLGIIDEFEPMETRDLVDTVVENTVHDRIATRRCLKEPMLEGAIEVRADCCVVRV